MEDFQYFGLFLDTETKNRLMDFLTDTMHYNALLNVSDKIYLDHCTLLHRSQLHGNSELYSYLKASIGKEFPIKLIAIGVIDTALAFKVLLPESGICANKTPHITIATYRGGKPVDSNNITDWELINPIRIVAKLKKR